VLIRNLKKRVGYDGAAEVYFIKVSTFSRSALIAAWSFRVCRIASSLEMKVSLLIFVAGCGHHLPCRLQLHDLDLGQIHPANYLLHLLIGIAQGPLELHNLILQHLGSQSFIHRHAYATGRFA